ncbi:hypothetical protein SHELI_v1c04170 [Spiroplasma helicoides]|uniref:Lipoprotein n=1 Tax=Spiroplasma helicoides TaxID=216938 RepID=A0A1B3SKC0_9MOLU|nr:hypothetical protein [Spiroplasma helicoides]AOG60368.1 hypothetical protein SHELI_v1c04170 [Spiroplasma helicoides]
MNRKISRVFLLSLVLGAPIFSISCDQHSMIYDQINDSPDTIADMIKDSFFNSKQKFKDQTEVLKYLKSILSSYSYVYFDDKSIIKEKDSYLFEYKEVSRNEQYFKYNFKLIGTKYIKNDIVFNHDDYYSFDIDIKRQLELVDNIEFLQTESETSSNNGFAYFTIKNIINYKNFKVKASSEEFNYKNFEYNKNNKNNFIIELYPLYDIDYQFIEFLVSSDNTSKNTTIKIKNNYYSSEIVVLNKKVVETKWADKFTFKILNYKILKNIKIEELNNRFTFAKNFSINNLTGDVEGLALFKDYNGISKTHEFTINIKADDVYEQSFLLKINKINIFENEDKNSNISIDVENPRVLKMSKNIKNLTLISIEDDFYYDNAMFLNGSLVDKDKKSYIGLNEIVVQAKRPPLNNAKKVNYFLIDFDFEYNNDGKKEILNVKGASIDFLVDKWSQKTISIFDKEAKIEVVNNTPNSYLKYELDKEQKNINIYTNSSKVDFKINYDFFRKTYNIKNFENEVEESIFAHTLGFYVNNKDPDYFVQYFIIRDRFRETKKVVFAYKQENSNLESFTITFLYFEV